MDRTDWITLVNIKLLVVDAAEAIQTDLTNIDYAIKKLDEAATKLHDLETAFIKSNNIGTMAAG